jgi:hypothetical protein
LPRHLEGYRPKDAFNADGLASFSAFFLRRHYHLEEKLAMGERIVRRE